MKVFPNFKQNLINSHTIVFQLFLFVKKITVNAKHNLIQTTIKHELVTIISNNKCEKVPYEFTTKYHNTDGNMTSFVVLLLKTSFFMNTSCKLHYIILTQNKDRTATKIAVFQFKYM